MHGITFEFNHEHLESQYKKDMAIAIPELVRILSYEGFKMVHHNFFVLKKSNPISGLNNAINRLHNIEWFSDSIRDARAFRITDMSEIVRNIKD